MSSNTSNNQSKDFIITFESLNDINDFRRLLEWSISSRFYQINNERNWMKQLSKYEN